MRYLQNSLRGNTGKELRLVGARALPMYLSPKAGGRYPRLATGGGRPPLSVAQCLLADGA